MHFSNLMTRHRVLAYVLAVFIAVISVGCSEPIDPTDHVSLEQARADHEAGKVMLVDIRETREHKTGVVAGAMLLPMSELGEKISLLPKDASQPVLLICNTQNRSKATLLKLKQQGYTNIRFVDGGMSQWAAKGWPMVVPQ
jgi:rhodanese-related sulfurtransferase